tara:strand:+ start:1517 stop:2047 length:531 start_codon:yes stop_codon:yes gene_type:complete
MKQSKTTPRKKKSPSTKYSAKSNLKGETTVIKIKKELAEEKDKYVRLFAEFENFKKRTAKERLDLFKTANSEVMSSLIPILDDYDRAIKQSENIEANDEINGLKLIFNKLIEIMKSNGLSETQTLKGDVFDAEIHEAITQIPSKKPDEKGKIIDIIEKGYQLGEKIIRYPKVVVAD